MRLLRLDEAAFGPDDTVFKENPTQALLFTAMFVAGALFFLGLWIEDEVGTFLGVLMVGMFGVFAAFTGNIARKAFRPNAWQMAVDGRRALIKFRSFLNTLHPETDPQVLEVGLDEIASVRENELVMLTAGHRGRKATTIERSVDIRVPGADLRPLAERLEVEREWKRTGFSIKAWPVALPEEGVIRVNFSSNVSHVKPPVGEAVRLLAVRSRGEPKDYLMVDLTAVYAIPAHDRERSLRALLHSGHYLLALQLARDLYGIKDEKAKEILARLEAPVPAAVTQPS